MQRDPRLPERWDMWARLEINPQRSLGGQTAEALLFWAPPEKAGFSGKSNKSGKGGRWQERRNTQYMRWTDSIKETTVLNLQELSKAVEAGTSWRREGAEQPQQRTAKPLG